MNLLVLVMGIGGGVGLWVVVLSFMPRRLSPSEEFAAAQEPSADRSLRGATRRVKDRVEEELRGNSALVQDARMIGRPVESHALMKITGLVLGAALLGGGGMFLSVMGLDVPPLMLVAAAGLGGLLGWWLPDSMLRTEAEKERRYFQQVTESWLELASQLVTAGSDTFAALTTAASYSRHPVFVTLADALRASAARGEPPWTGLRRMADERRLGFLDPFCAALELAGTTGAGSRVTILSQVESARSKAMHEADARAASSGEKMGAPLALIGSAFMILMGYPPLAGIMDSGSFSGPGL